MLFPYALDKHLKGICLRVKDLDTYVRLLLLNDLDVKFLTPPCLPPWLQLFLKDFV